MYEFTNKVSYVLERLKLSYSQVGQRAILAAKNEGVDYKAVSHAFRAGYQALHIYKDGDFSYPLPENEFIMKVKKGEISFNEFSPILEELVDEVIDLSEKSDLPEKVDQEFVDSFILKCYKHVLTDE